MLEIKERDPLSNLILEVLEDPSKKEMIYYLLCYTQLAKREESFSIELNRFLSYSYRNFQKARSYWKDLLVSMNLFSISDIYGNVYEGKDIYKVEDDGIYLISLKKDYLNQIAGIHYRVLKLWNILSKVATYRRYFTAQDAVIISALMFNEGLYQEVENYCEICLERYPHEYPYFITIYTLSQFYSTGSKEAFQELMQRVKDLEGIGEVYYGINLLKLRRDIENLIKRLEKGGYPNPIRIEFINQRNKSEGFLSRVIKRIKHFIKGLFIRERSYRFEGNLCSKSFRILYISS